MPKLDDGHTQILKRDIVVIGASAGGVEALITVIRNLPAELPAAIFVVLHVAPFGGGNLPAILARHGKLPVMHPADGQSIEHGRVYIAAPNTHMLVKPGFIRVTDGPKENGFRPAVDPLFRSAARAYETRVVGVILTGTLDDGTAGLHTVKYHGGLSIVQDPADALFSSMPQSAIENVQVDWIVPVSGIGQAIAQLVMDTADGEIILFNKSEIQDEVVEIDPIKTGHGPQPGTPSGFTCPECHGPLWEIEEGDLLRYRCHIGHAYSVKSLAAANSEALDAAIWTAVRSLEEKVAIGHSLASRARERGHVVAQAQFESDLRDAEKHLYVLKGLLKEDRWRAPELAPTDLPETDPVPGRSALSS